MDQMQQQMPPPMPIGTCHVCRSPIYRWQRVRPVPSAGIADIGEKSGAMIIVFDNDEPWDLVHEGCVIGAYDPHKNQLMYDDWYERLRAQIRQEELEQLQKEAEERAVSETLEEIEGLRSGRLCLECRQEVELSKQEANYPYS